LENIPNRWIEELQEGCPKAKTILVALKCDLRDDEVALQKMKPVSYEEVCVILCVIHPIHIDYINVHYRDWKWQKVFVLSGILNARPSIIVVLKNALNKQPK
jgi:GTPase SAR1 family protein